MTTGDVDRSRANVGDIGRMMMTTGDTEHTDIEVQTGGTTAGSAATTTGGEATIDSTDTTAGIATTTDTTDTNVGTATTIDSSDTTAGVGTTGLTEIKIEVTAIVASAIGDTTRSGPENTTDSAATNATTTEAAPATRQSTGQQPAHSFTDHQDGEVDVGGGDLGDQAGVDDV